MLSQKAVLGETAGKRGRVRPPCWPPHPLLLSCSLHRGHGSGVWQRKRMKKPGGAQPSFTHEGHGEPCSRRVLWSLLGTPPGSPGKAVPAFLHIVPDGRALPEPFQHCGEGEREENGTFFYFPSFRNFSAITKSHIAANFPASVHTGILQGHRNSSMRAVGSSDAPRAAQRLAVLPEPPTYQLPALSSTGAASGPASCPGPWWQRHRAEAEASAEPAAPGPLMGWRWESREAGERLRCHPCGVQGRDGAEN